MLVLRRKAGEAIVLNGVITIHVLAVEGERVKLGISAPPEVVIVRSELLENQGAAPGSPSQSGGYWSNREPQRPSRDRTGGESGQETRQSPMRRPDSDSRDAVSPSTEWPDADEGRSAPASIQSGPIRES